MPNGASWLCQFELQVKGVTGTRKRQAVASAKRPQGATLPRRHSRACGRFTHVRMGARQWRPVRIQGWVFFASVVLPLVFFADSFFGTISLPIATLHNKCLCFFAALLSSGQGSSFSFLFRFKDQVLRVQVFYGSGCFWVFRVKGFGFMVYGLGFVFYVQGLGSKTVDS